MNSSTPNHRAKVLLVGLGTTTASALEALAERFAVVGLVRPDCEPDAIIDRARELGIPVIGSATVDEVERALAERNPDCVVVSSFHRILPDSLLAAGRFVNVHYALLPRYRGRANVNWAIINGETETGISIHRMAPGLDAGEILYQASVPIGPDDNVTMVYERLNQLQRESLGGAVQRLLAGECGEPQDEAGATYGCTRLPDDGEIDWSAPTERLHNLIRALTPPFPGAFTYFEGRKLIVWRAAKVIDAPQYDGRIPGRVVRVSKAEGSVDVLTGDGALRLVDVQREDEPVRPAVSVIRSVKATLGLQKAELLRRLQRLENELARVTAALDRAPSQRAIHGY